MLELTDAQKMIVVVCRWRDFSPSQTMAVTVMPTDSSMLAYHIHAYFRSDECLNRVSVLQETFGNYGS